jgi:iron(III) transport system ATP-binding protein
VATPEELFRRPADPWVARFLGAGCLLPATSDGRVVTSALGALELVDGAPTGPVEVLVRPDQLAIAAPGTDSGAPGVVTGVEFGGATSEVEVDVAGTRMVATVLGRPGHRVGDTVSIMVREPVLAFGTT